MNTTLHEGGTIPFERHRRRSRNGHGDRAPDFGADSTLMSRTSCGRMVQKEKLQPSLMGR